MILKSRLMSVLLCLVTGILSPGQESGLIQSEFQFQASLLQVEESRDEFQLLKLIKYLKPERTEIAKQLARAAGRISSFKSWKILSKRYARNREITDTLAIAARFPESDFPKTRTFEILKTFPPSGILAETLLHLNLKDALQHALTLKQYLSSIAANLWRSKDHLTPELLKAFYKTTT